MADSFIGEIRMFGFNFPPRSWAQCDGQLLAISQNTALFSILGTTYGGDGRSTFGLPNLRGQVALGSGSGPGLTPRDLGETAGAPSVTIDQTTMPVHSHAVQGLAQPAQIQGPSSTEANSSVALASGVYASGASVTVQMATAMLGQVGGNQPHTNFQPYQVVNFCITLVGVFPPRT